MFKKKTKERGFTIIELIMAILILMIGILAMVSVLTINLVRSYEAENRIVAKQLAVSTIESIISAKDIQRAGVIAGWDSIKNSIDNPPAGFVNGIFLRDFRPVREDLGWDGVAGTVDDACPDTGNCVVTGRPTNTSPVLKMYERRIVITDIEDPERPTPLYEIFRRRIDVTIKFSLNGVVREEAMSTIITNY